MYNYLCADMPTRLLFLTAQLQPFLLSGIKSLCTLYDVEVLVYTLEKEENFQYDIPKCKELQIVYYAHFPEKSFKKNLVSFQPDIVFCAGWMFPIYLNWCRQLKKNGVRTICAMDTQWKGTFKQRFLVLFAHFAIKKSFTHAWVPGPRQASYAMRLGFDASKVLDNLYAPNTNMFANIFDANSSKKYFKKFLYVGRLESHKVLNLLKAFVSLSPAELDGWQIQFVGNGSMTQHPLLRHPGVLCQSFLPQEQLFIVANKASVFCLCSAEEPWGTVVQEFAAAGLPLLVSLQCGSSDVFLKNNGIICDGASVENIRNGLLQFISMSDNELNQMALESHHLGITSNSDTWAHTLMQLR
ncbi:MAG: glycosyltransferase [Chitinophagaceae bacterium]|nr:glycosyltransferase [Chitinophagaceae bacterium]